MGSLKRKNGSDTHTGTKATKLAEDPRPQKRTKSTKPSRDESGPRTKKVDHSSAKTATKFAVPRIKDDEPLFPRGGGSVLTPLEHKQIGIQAKNDVLFEQESGLGAQAEKASKKKQRRPSGPKPANGLKTGDKTDEDSVKIEGLNFNRLVRGSLVLGQVCAVTPLEVQLALPNNIFGHIPITAVSGALTKRLEDTAEAPAEDDDSDAGEGGDEINLSSIFLVGQYLRAYVTSTLEEAQNASGKTRKRIELSVKPEQANVGMRKEDIVPNCTLMASVVSAEDHGFVMDVGATDSSVRGFLPRKEVEAGTTEARMQPGAVLLCVVTGRSANGKVIQLSGLSDKVGALNKTPSEATTINSFLPGTATDVLISEISGRGIAGKVMGHLDVTADLIHSGAGAHGVDLATKYKVGAHVKARIICTFPTADDPKLGISLLPHITSLKAKLVTDAGVGKQPLDILSSSSLVKKCLVKRVEPEIGLFVDVGVKEVPGFVHISRVKDGKVDALYESSGPYKVGSVHEGRVLGYTPMDCLFSLSFEQHILDQKYLRVEDVPVGERIEGVIERLLITEQGVTGLVVQITEGISGLVPEIHMADVRLQHPEKMFTVGKKVSARVLSTNPAEHQVRLTLKKTLVNSDAPLLKSTDEVFVGLQTLGTIVKVLQSGAVVRFYGAVKGFLPISEMSEAYISDPREHFRTGQVVNVHVLDFDKGGDRLIVSCKDPSAFGLEKQVALKNLKIGDIVSGTVTQKTDADIWVELADSSLKALLPVGQLTDKSAKKTQSALKKIRVGQVLQDLVVLEKNEGRRSITVSQKPSLIEASRAGKILLEVDKAAVGDLVAGFVNNITPTAVFVQFGGRLSALLPKSKLPTVSQSQPDFGMHKFQSVTVKVAAIDREHGRMVVAIPSEAAEEAQKAAKPAETKARLAVNPLDDSITSIDDVTIGKILKARIVSIRDTQLNVELADNIQGRVDVSQAFDSWEDLTDPKQPLQKFHTQQVLRTRVLGVHDARNHRFLPISHRSTRPVLELSIKPSDLIAEVLPEPLSFEKVEVGASFLGFVNNVAHNCLWISLSPNVRGRVSATEASHDYSRIKDLAANFPVGSALRVRVLAVDADSRHLDLSARAEDAAPQLSWDTIKPGLVVPGRVTRVNDRHVMINLSESLAGPIYIVDLADDYDLANPLKYAKNDIGHFSVVSVDKSNKRLRLSSRPSRVLDSSLPVKDREISQVSQIKSGDLIRGFVKNVSDKGLYVNLGGDVVAFVKISDLSDKFLKAWKEHFQVDQLVKGRVTGVDLGTGHVQMSLKDSVVAEDYILLISMADLKVGQVVTGKVRKVMDFGAFIVVDGSANVSGLCHRSEMADNPVEDATKLYSEGDMVKAVVLKIEADKKRVNFGLKPSYFPTESDDEMEVDDDDDAAGGVALDRAVADEDEDMAGNTNGVVRITGTDNLPEEPDSDDEMEDVQAEESLGLDAGGFDWSADALDIFDEALQSKDGVTTSNAPARKPRAAHIQVDRTGELDAHGPQTASDYERLLLGQPDASRLWIAYMAFQMQVGELAKARDVAERALRTIGIHEEADKLNVWTAYLNLEVAYGTDDKSVDDVFQRACQTNDAQAVHERLASIYIQSGKHEAADALFQQMLKKFGSKSPSVWLNYAHFLHATLAQPPRARALLPRALQALPPHAHAPTTVRFAALEFRSPHGEPERGRTMFEGLVTTWPRKLDLWNQLVDLEMSVFAAAKAEAAGAAAGPDPEPVRDVFERATKVPKLKPRWAKGWFQRWAKWEEENGDAASRGRVSAKAKEWIARAEARKKERETEAEEGDGEEEHE